MLLAQLFNGLNASALYLMMALGLVIIFGHMQVVNLAHGELIMIGAYVAYYLFTFLGMPVYLSMFFAFLVTAALGFVIEKVLIKRIYGKISETLLATYGLSLILQQAVRAISGSELKYVGMPFEGSFSLGKAVIPFYNVFVAITALFMLLCTWILFYKTPFGKKMRAITQNRVMTECLGIDTSRTDTWTFAYGAGLAGLAGAVLAPIRGVSPAMGAQYLTDAFLTVVVGGVNSLIGTLSGSLMIGESISLLGIVGNEVNAKILVFIIIIIIIRFKPEGLFSSERR